MAKIFFDFDGVLVRSRFPDRTFLWQKNIELDLRLPLAVRDLLFQQPEWNEILAGRGDFRKKIEEVFQQNDISTTAKDFIDYWLSRDLNWRHEVLDVAAKLKGAGHSLYVASNQDRIRTGYIAAQKEVSSLFEGVFSSCELGLTKPNPKFYQRIKEQNFFEQCATFLFIDDDQRNIEAANSIGWSGIHFNPDSNDGHSTESLKTALAMALQNTVLPPLL